MRRRGLTETDRRAWADYVQRVAPLAGVISPVLELVPEATPAPASPTPPPPVHPLVRRKNLAPIEIGTSPGGVDRSTWMRFRGGKLAPQRTLDLHGRTVQRAHAELHAFFGAATAERLRCIEIITGRGSGETGGVLRREVPLWLNDPALRPIILAASHPHPANQGAIRVLLRRIR